MLGWENVFHCEINGFGRKVLEYWFPDSESYEDITKTDFTKFRGTIDVLTGGFPCQPFSYAGKRGGQSDERYLWPEMLRVINEVRPTWVIGENVAGIATMVESCKVTDMGSEATLFEASGGIHRYTAEFAFTIERICSDLESEGYSVQPMLIPACAVGAPHRRDRVFFIAHNNFASDSIHQGSLRNASTNATKEGKERLSERNEVQWSNEPADARSQMCDIASNCDCKGLEGQNESRSGEGRKRMYIWRNLAGCCGADDLRPERRWQTFPTVSAVHRGNDGIPFDVDSLTISFSKWRTETIKAYGNAIVPQVMYRIFEAIEALENE
jgi:DNA (cytosine-5)-methyltransferase 1